MWCVVIMVVGCGSNDNGLMVRESVEWMVCYSDGKGLHQRVLSVIHKAFKFER